MILIQTLIQYQQVLSSFRPAFLAIALVLLSKPILNSEYYSTECLVYNQQCAKVVCVPLSS